MFRPSRNRSGGGDPFVVWKVRLFGVGAALALSGIGFEVSWVVWAGVGVLAIGLFLRFIPRGGGDE